jgi:spermidine synthase
LDGLHVVANLYRCRSGALCLTEADPLRQFCLEQVRSAGLTVLKELFHQFPGQEGADGAQGTPDIHGTHGTQQSASGGVTGCIVLAESHLAIHTWPELNAVTLDVYVCNYTQDNSAKARSVVDALIVLFDPEDLVRHDVPRGRQYLYESLNTEDGFFIGSQKRLLALRTAHQDLEVHETASFGRLLRLDGCFMTSEKDEFHYHENLVHPALVAHPQPRRVLIIGGGDGGAAEEVLKHPSVESVTLVELDAQVVEVARRHFQSIHHNVFDNARLTLVIGDGLRYVAESAEHFDLILLDLPDPIGPAGALYEAAFFSQCRQRLAPGGALALHMGSPVAQPQRVRTIYRHLDGLFATVRPCAVFIPLYGSLWSMAVCSDSLDPLALGPEAVEARIAERGLEDLQYYNGQTHQAIFALPNYLRALTAGSASSRGHSSESRPAPALPPRRAA